MNARSYGGHDVAGTMAEHDGQLSTSAVGELVSAAADGVALLDGSGRCRYLNPAGYRILRGDNDGRTEAELVAHLERQLVGGGSYLAFDDCDGVGRIEATAAAHDLDDERFEVVTFRRVRESAQTQHKLAAVAETAARIAVAGALSGTLDLVATEVTRATRMSTCQLIVTGTGNFDAGIKWHRNRIISKHGVSGSRTPPTDLPERLAECEHRGARFISLETLQTGRTVICRHRSAEILADSRWEPLHDIVRNQRWDTQVSVPLIARGRTVGVLNGFYPIGHDPSSDDLAFLRAMCDQAAMAIENARMLAELRDKSAIEERHRLARELHDSVCQALFSMTLHIRAVNLALDQGAGDALSEGAGDALDRARRGIVALRELTQTTLKEMRALVLELGPGDVREEGLATALRRHAMVIGSREGLLINVDVPAEPLPLDGAAEESLYRVAQEALHNVVKHADARSVNVFLGPDPACPSRVLLEVADDGVGFDPGKSQPGHVGLMTMQDRATQLGGSLRVDSRPDRGSTVQVIVPPMPVEASRG